MHISKTFKLWARIKNFIHAKIAPKGLIARFLLMIILPLLILQLVISFLFYEQHWHIISQKMARSITSDIEFLLNITEDESINPQKQKDILQLAEKNLAVSILFTGKTELPEITKPANKIILDELIDSLKEKFEDNFVIEEGSRKKTINIYLLWKNEVVIISVPTKRFFSSTAFVFPAWLFGSGLFLFTIAGLFMRVQIRSIKRLSVVADKFGKGQDMPNFKPEGATEVRQAGKAFILMRERIKKQLDERTAMLAGVSHDLRTPLTRMQLELAMMPGNSEKNNMSQDIKEMEKMIEGYLTFARGEGKEPFQKAEISDIINELAEKSRKSFKSLDVNIETPVTMMVRKSEFTRCLSNLIGNASRYATRASINLGIRNNFLEITIDDNGPGIPLEKRQEVFKAFYRLESSRNQQTGGVGLGLALVKDTVIAHGGEIFLDDSPTGGLRVRLKFPL